MGYADKFNNKIQELRGRTKRRTGDATGNRRLQAEGHADEVGSAFKRAAEKLKDTFRGRRADRGRRRY